MGLERHERIARELTKQWPDGERHHYVVVSSPEHGVIAVSGASSETMQRLLGLVIAEALGVTIPDEGAPAAQKAARE